MVVVECVLRNEARAIGRDWIVEGFEDHIKNLDLGTSLVVQWLGLGAFTAMAPGSIPGRGAKIPKACSMAKKKKKEKKNTWILSSREKDGRVRSNWTW